MELTYYPQQILFLIVICFLAKKSCELPGSSAYWIKFVDSQLLPYVQHTKGFKHGLWGINAFIKIEDSDTKNRSNVGPTEERNN